MIGISETNNPYKIGPEKYKIEETRVKAHLGLSKMFYYLVNDFHTIGPFYSREDALYWKLQLEKIK